jgi:peptidoglycan/LPS O-acetylase OafA/YrhL
MTTDPTIPTAARPSKPERRYDMDWLRVLATLLVFLYHCTRP